MTETAVLPLRRRDGTTRATTTVDATDFEWLNQWRWCVRGLPERLYVQRRVNGKAMLLHRFIVGLTPGDTREVDHRNGNTLDNRWSNLRVVTHAQNQQNMRAHRDSTSRHRGVSFAAAKGRWRAEARVDGRPHHLGYFDNEDEAAAIAAAFRAEHMPYAIEAAA